MKKRFSEGEEVVCITKEFELIRGTGKFAPDLVYNEIYTIFYDSFNHGRWWLRVAGTPFGSVYTEDTFAPITQISELLEDVNEKVLEKQLKRILK